MTMFDVNDLGAFERRGSGVRTSGEILHTYDLTVIASDADSMVASAGGWLCDRVRAGWQVTVVVPEAADVRALTILGVAVETSMPHDEALQQPAAAVAVDASVLRRDDSVRRDVLRLVDSRRVEVTVWGEAPLFGSDARFERVRHRLSAAARAFKSGALRTSGHAETHSGAEEFVSTALWYPPDGADLVPIAER